MNNKAIEHIRNADAQLARLSVSGEAVMVMAAVRSELKAALTLAAAKTPDKSAAEEGDKDGG